MKAPLAFTTAYNPYIQPREIKKFTNKHWPKIQKQAIAIGNVSRAPSSCFQKGTKYQGKLIRAKLTKDTQVSKNLLPDNAFRSELATTRWAMFAV